MTYVYVLELEENRYYVGKTLHPDFHFNREFTSYAPEWTNRYRPIKLLELVSFSSLYDVDRYVIKYMKKYGMDNVRGGDFYKFELDIDTRRVLTHMINNYNQENVLGKVLNDEVNEELNNILTDDVTGKLEELNNDPNITNNDLNNFINENINNFIVDNKNNIDEYKLHENISDNDLNQFMNEVLEESNKNLTEYNNFNDIELMTISMRERINKLDDIKEVNELDSSSDDSDSKSESSDSKEINESDDSSNPEKINKDDNINTSDEINNVIEKINEIDESDKVNSFNETEKYRKNVNIKNEYCTCILSKLFNHKKCIKNFLGY